MILRIFMGAGLIKTPLCSCFLFRLPSMVDDIRVAFVVSRFTPPGTSTDDFFAMVGCQTYPFLLHLIDIIQVGQRFFTRLHRNSC